MSSKTLFDGYQHTTTRDIRYQRRWEKLMRMLKAFLVRRICFIFDLTLRKPPSSTLPCRSRKGPSTPPTESSAAAFYGEPIMNFFSRYKTWFVGLSLFLSFSPSPSLSFSLTLLVHPFLKRREVSRSRTLISLAALLITHGVLSSLPPIEVPYLPSLPCYTLVSPTFASYRQPLHFYTHLHPSTILSWLFSPQPRKILFWSRDCGPVYISFFSLLFHI